MSILSNVKNVFSDIDLYVTILQDETPNTKQILETLHAPDVLG